MPRGSNTPQLCYGVFDFKYKGKKTLTESEQILFTAAKDYLKGVMNGKTALPIKAWKEEQAKLSVSRKTRGQKYLALKEEMKEAEQIRKSVYSILRQEQPQHRARDMVKRRRNNPPPYVFYFEIFYAHFLIFLCAEYKQSSS